MRKQPNLRALLLSAVATNVLIAAPAWALPTPAAEVLLAPPGEIPSLMTNNSSPSASVYNEFNSGLNRGYASGYADQAFVTRAYANVDGSGGAGGTAILTETIVNNTGSLVDYYFAFQIYGGSLLLSNDGLSISSTDTASSSFSSVVKVDGSDIWSLSVALDLADSVYSVADGNGDDSGELNFFYADSDSNGAYAGWSASVFKVHLGTLAPTQSLTMEYILSAAVFGSYAGVCSDNGGDGGGDMAMALLTSDGYGGGCYANYASAADPAGIEGTALGITSELASTSVPEPAALGLMGIGLAGMGLARRRFKKQ